jgi:hypothetical protein
MIGTARSLGLTIGMPVVPSRDQNSPAQDPADGALEGRPRPHERPVLEPALELGVAGREPAGLPPR